MGRGTGYGMGRSTGYGMGRGTGWEGVGVGGGFGKVG